jgi:lipopolysaccharide/colanic/teichoic acid biosynthesis glycosyltransferase
MSRALAVVALLMAAPILLLAAAGILVADGRPLLYTCRRAGRFRTPFRLYKLRTMRSAPGGARITAGRDGRVFRFGAVLRALKIDELPQLWNIVRGDMALFGLRPEDPVVLARDYPPGYEELLDALPGLTSPGSVHGSYLGAAIPDGREEDFHAHGVLPDKLALDLYFARHRTFVYDLRVAVRTAGLMARALLRLPPPPPPPELQRARLLWMQVQRRALLAGQHGTEVRAERGQRGERRVQHAQPAPGEPARQWGGERHPPAAHAPAREQRA